MIRQASLYDLDEIATTFIGLQVECPDYADIELSPEKIKNHLSGMLEDKQFVGVYEVDSAIVGVFIAQVYEPWCSTTKIASPIMNYIKPQYRIGMGHLRMLEHYIKWAQDNQAAVIEIVTSSGLFNADRLYKAVGFNHSGNVYRFRGEINA